MSDGYWDQRRVDVGIEVEPGRGSDWAGDAAGRLPERSVPIPPAAIDVGMAIPGPGTPQIDIDVPPDRQLNQFWYSASTLKALVELILPGGGGGGEAAAGLAKVAYVSAPTAFFEVLAHQAAAGASTPTEGLLLEYDRRFAANAAAAVPHAAFEFFDYTAGPGTEGDRPDSCHDGTCSLVLCDPPFLSRACWTSFVATAVRLAKPGGHFLFASIPENHEMLQALVVRDLRMAAFVPVQHGISHRFRWFTTLPVERCGPIERPNTGDAELIAEKERIAGHGAERDGCDDPIDDLFASLQGACISSLQESG